MLLRSRQTRSSGCRKLLYLLVAVCASFGGCGECVLCGVDSKVTPSHDSGTAIIEVQGLASLVTGDGAKFVAISFSGRATTPGGTGGRGDFDFQRTYEVRASGVNPEPHENRPGLQPGTWQIRVRSGDWEATCEGAVAVNSATTFVFHFGQPGCSVQ
jgi:hypothetical protein